MTPTHSPEEELSAGFRARFLSLSLSGRRKLLAASSPFPRFLYKYRELPRSADKPVDLVGLEGLLARNEVFYSSPYAFNDKHEGLLSFSIPEDATLLREAMVAVSARAQGISKLKARATFDSRLIADRAKLTQRIEAAIRKTMGTAGVVSLTDDPRNTTMWAYYASSGAGVCVQLAPHFCLDPLGISSKVTYLDDKPRSDVMLEFLHDRFAKRLEKTLLSKARNYRHEREWRLIHRGAGEVEVMSPQAVSGVIFGPDVTEYGASLVRELLVRRRTTGRPLPKIYSARPHPQHYRMEITRRRDIETGWYG